MRLIKGLLKTRLHTRILIGLLAGIPVGLLLGPRAELIEPVGRLFIRLIRMVVVPLVFSSLFVGTASLGDVRKLGRIGLKTIVYYLCTTAIAISIGLILGNVFKPGNAIDPSTRAGLMASYEEETAQKLDFAGKKIVVTPDDPHRFAEVIRAQTQ